MKTVKISQDTWKKLMHLKIDLDVGTIDSAIQHLLSTYQTEKQVNGERRERE